MFDGGQLRVLALEHASVRVGAGASTRSCVRRAVPRTLPSHPLIVGVGGFWWVVLLWFCFPRVRRWVRADRMAGVGVRAAVRQAAWHLYYWSRIMT